MAQLEAQQTALKGRRRFFARLRHRSWPRSRARPRPCSRAGALRRPRRHGLGHRGRRCRRRASATPSAATRSWSTSWRAPRSSRPAARTPTRDTTIVASGGTPDHRRRRPSRSTGDTTLQGLADAINQTREHRRHRVGGLQQRRLHARAHRPRDRRANGFTITNNLTRRHRRRLRRGQRQDAVATRPARSTASPSRAAPTSSTARCPGGTLTPVTKPGRSLRGDHHAATRESIKNLVKAFQEAYNDLVDSSTTRQRRPARRTRRSIGRDPLVRSLRSQLARVLNTEQAIGGDLHRDLAGGPRASRATASSSSTRPSSTAPSRTDAGQRRAAVQGQTARRSACSARSTQTIRDLHDRAGPACPRRRRGSTTQLAQDRPAHRRLRAPARDAPRRHCRRSSSLPIWPSVSSRPRRGQLSSLRSTQELLDARRLDDPDSLRAAPTPTVRRTCSPARRSSWS